jgi:adenylate cyclase
MAGTRSRLATLASGIAVGAVCAALLGIPVVRDLEQEFGLPWLFKLRGPMHPPDEVVVVAMDHRAASRIYLPRDSERFHRCEGIAIGRAPSTHVSLPALPSRWPRCLHAQLTDRLAAAGAGTIVFDVLFRERPPLPGATEDLHAWQDNALASAIGLSGRTVIAQKAEVIDGGEALAGISAVIENAALGAAPFPLLTVTGRRVDAFMAFKESGLVTPTLPVIAVQAHQKSRYAVLANSLEQYAGKDAGLLPTEEQAFRAGGHLQATSLLIRQLFRADSTLADRVCGERSRPRTRSTGSIPNEDLRKLVSVYTGDGTKLLNFYGPAGTFRTIAYDEVLSASDELLASLVRGRAVFVGYAESARQEQVEHFATAFSSGDSPDLSGVEIAATAFSNLLDDTTIARLPYVNWVILTFLMGLLSFVLCERLSNGVALAVMSGVLPLYGGAALYLLASRELWIPVVAPMLVAGPVGILCAFSWKYWTAYRQREQLRRAFSYFVPSEVVSMLESNAAQVGNARESLECACVSTDAANYTPLAEAMTPEALTEFLDHYFEALFGGVAHHGGFVSDVVGDGMMAIWPHRLADTHLRLLRALLEMRDAAQRFQQSLGGNELMTRFGVDWGRVALTTVGALVHYEYRAVGDAVNTAQRIQELNKQLGTRVLVSSPAIGHAGADFLLRDLGHFLLRGKSHAVHVYELMESKANATPEQYELCAQFAAAIEALYRGERQVAVSRFQKVHHAFPADGPTMFFLRTLESGAGLQNGALVTD